MPIDPHRALVQKRELAIAIEALMREEAVVNYYAARGKKVISVDDNQTRAVLKMGGAEPAADILVELSPGQLVIAEVKGSDIDRALTQLKAQQGRQLGDIPALRAKSPFAITRPALTLLTFGVADIGFRAIRIFHNSFPGEWILYEYLARTKLSPLGSDPSRFVSSLVPTSDPDCGPRCPPGLIGRLEVRCRLFRSNPARARVTD